MLSRACPRGKLMDSAGASGDDGPEDVLLEKGKDEALERRRLETAAVKK